MSISVGPGEFTSDTKTFLLVALVGEFCLRALITLLPPKVLIFISTITWHTAPFMAKFDI